MQFQTPPHPSEHDEASSREYSLMDQWVALTEERAAVKLPAANSRIPGAPSDWYGRDYGSQDYGRDQYMDYGNQRTNRELTVFQDASARRGEPRARHLPQPQS